MTEHTTDLLDSKEFYELMQQYRHTPITEQKLTSEAFEEVKKYIETHFLPKQIVEEAIGEDEKLNGGSGEEGEDWVPEDEIADQWKGARNELRAHLRKTLGLKGEK